MIGSSYYLSSFVILRSSLMITMQCPNLLFPNIGVLFMKMLRLWGIALLSLLSVASVAGAPRAAQLADIACPNGTCTAYMPLISYEVLPIYLSPPNNAQLASYAPILSWRPALAGLHKIQVSTDATFSPVAPLVLDTTKQAKLPLPAQLDTIISANLKPGTTYYWRVGVVLPEGETYSVAQSFATPAAGAVALPGLVQLVSPKNKAILKGSEALLQWQPYGGALLYRIKVYDAAGNEFEPGSTQLAATQTSFLVKGLQRGTYTWKMKVYTETGWGEYSPIFTFTMA